MIRIMLALSSEKIIARQTYKIIFMEKKNSIIYSVKIFFKNQSKLKAFLSK